MAKHPVTKGELAQSAILFGKRAKKRGRRPRSTEIELSERRQEVIRLRLRGMTLREIAKSLGCGAMTIKRDLDAVKQEVHQKVSQFDRDYALGTSLSVYEQIEKEAWEQYYGCSQGSPGRAQFLNLVRTARNDQVKLLADVGLISRAPTQVQHQFEANQVLKGWTDDAKRIVALAIIRSQMDGGDVPKALSEPQEGGNGRGVLIDASSEPSTPVEAPNSPEKDE